MNHRILLASVFVAASSAAVFITSESIGAHGSEARLVRELAWKKPRIARALAVNRSELGLSGSKVPAEVQTIGGQPCVVGPLVALDVDDQFAFDIDEAVDVTLTYATPMTTPFTVAWDRNGGDGYGVSTEIAPSAGAGPHSVTLRLDRARFAGQGSKPISPSARAAAPSPSATSRLRARARPRRRAATGSCGSR